MILLYIDCKVVNSNLATKWCNVWQKGSGRWADILNGEVKRIGALLYNIERIKGLISKGMRECKTVKS